MKFINVHRRGYCVVWIGMVYRTHQEPFWTALPLFRDGEIFQRGPNILSTIGIITFRFMFFFFFLISSESRPSPSSATKLISNYFLFVTSENRSVLLGASGNTRATVRDLALQMT